MQFSFTVGNQEKHKVDYHFNQMWGKTTIKVDDKKVFSAFKLFKSPFSTKQEPVTFEVGDKEKHKVAIQQTTAPFMAGFFSVKYEAYVDDKLINTYDGH